MVVGVDLRIFQIGHQYRGIGAHIKNLFKEFSEMDDLPEFVFFEHPNVDSGIGVIKPYLANINYTIRRDTNERLVGETYLQREWASFKQRVIDGDAGLKNLTGIDVLLSIDFNLGVPRKNKIKTVLITYDMIPWVLSEHYLPNFIQSIRLHKSFKRAVKAQLDKRLYYSKFKQANKRAEKVLSISEHTKKDLIKYLNISPRKIKPVLLGVSDKPKKLLLKKNINTTSASDKSLLFSTNKSPFVFFMGGADRRRRIEDLVASFETSKVEIPDLKLILAGYDFQSLQSVPDVITKKAINDSYYKDDILFAGFITEEERNSLFKNAIAFVFPSIYEGFGLPILEAMQLECPVVTYRNSSIEEVGGDAVLYAQNAEDIKSCILDLKNSNTLRDSLLEKFDNQLSKFSWKLCASKTLAEIKIVGSSRRK